MNHPDLQKPVEYLTCCVCGEGTKGRQWWNRDTGFGACPSCVKWVASRGRADENSENLYGVAGVHHSLPEELREDSES